MAYHISTIALVLLGMFSFYLIVVSYRQSRRALELGLHISRLTWSRIDTTNGSPEFAREVFRTNVLITLAMIGLAIIIVSVRMFG